MELLVLWNKGLDKLETRFNINILKEDTILLLSSVYFILHTNVIWSYVVPAHLNKIKSWKLLNLSIKLSIYQLECIFEQQIKKVEKSH